MGRLLSQLQHHKKKAGVLMLSLYLLLSLGACAGRPEIIPTPEIVLNKPSVPLQVLPTPEIKVEGTKPLLEVLRGRLSISESNFDIEPSKLRISYLKAGSEIEFSIMVYNVSNNKVDCVARVRNPDYTEKGYDIMLGKYLSWLSIGEYDNLIKSKTEMAIPVRFSIPNNIELDSLNREIWISITDANEKDVVRSELCLRLLLVFGENEN